MKAFPIAVSACLLFAALPGLRAQRLPAWVFVRGASYADAKLSPDGRHLGFTSYVGDKDAREALFICDLATGKITKVEAPPVADNRVIETFSLTGAMVVKNFTWVNNHRIILVADQMNSVIGWTAGLAAVNIDGSQWELLTGVYRWDDAATIFGTEILYAAGDSDSVLMQQVPLYSFDRPTVLEINTVRGNMGVVADDSESMNGWVTDRDGHVRIGIKFDGEETRVIYRASDESPWVRLRDFDSRGAGNHPLAIDYDGRTAYTATLTPEGTWGISSYDLAAQRQGPLIFADKTYDVVNPGDFRNRSSLLFSKKKRKLIGLRYVAELERTVWFDAEMRQIQGMIDHALPGVANTIIGMSDDENRIMIRSWSDRHPGIFYLLDRESQQLRKIVDTAPWIRPGRMAKTLPLQYNARDGLLIHGYVTLPRGQQKTNLPLVVMPHGGPWVRDVLSYDPMVQFLANRGYAVLQVNYRGSPGYGEAFSQAGHHQIGKAIQNDITDGVKWAIQTGIADPRRVAIVGGSYGGYSVEWALTNTPELYRCGVSIAGVSDWLRIIKGENREEETRSAYRYWKEQIGDPDTDEATLREISPLYHVDRIRAPIFIAHGQEDPVVPISQSRRLVAELKDRGLSYEEMFRPAEGHGFSSYQDRLELDQRIEAFLDKNMK